MPYRSFIVRVHNYEHTHHHEVDDESNYWSVEAIDVTTRYAFAKEYAMMVVVWHADVTVFTMLHIIWDIHVAFGTVKSGWRSLWAIRVWNIYFLWPVELLAFRLLPLSLFNSIGFSLQCAHLNIILQFLSFILLLSIPLFRIIQVYLFFDSRIPKDSAEKHCQIDGNQRRPHIHAIRVSVLNHIYHEHEVYQA